MRRRVPKETPAETAQARAVREELEAMFEHAGVGPIAEAKRQARFEELSTLPRPLTDDERAELKAIRKRREKDRRRDQAWRKAVDRRQARHPEENRGEAALAVALEQGEKRRQRDERREGRRGTAERQAVEERAVAPAQATREPSRTPVAEAPAVQPEQPAAPSARRRQKSGVVAVYDLSGNRII